MAYHGDRIVAGAPGASFSLTAAAAPGGGRGTNGAAGRQGGAAAGTANPAVVGTPVVGAVPIQQTAAQAIAATAARGGRGAAAPVTGMVVVFDQNPAKQWRATGTFTPFDFAAARFGASVSIVGDDLWIGAPMADGMGRIFRIHSDKDGS